jgi:hypothetical protein
MSEKDLRDLIGDPHRLDADLQKFRKDIKLLSSKHLDFSGEYSKRWIAVYGGEVQADAESLDHLLARLDALKIPRGKAAIRYMNQSTRRMILYRMTL